MGNSISKVSVRLEAQSKHFNRGMKQAEGALGRFGKKGGATIGKIAGIAAAAYAAQRAMRAMSGAIKNSMSRLDQLAKTSDRLGMTTEALAGMEHAANLSGASIKELHTGLRDMRRRVSEAAQGTGEATQALAELGLSATRLSKMSPDEQFRTIADAMGHVTNSGDKVRLTYDIMGRSGTKLINTLNLGAAGLSETADEADKLGLAVSRVDAAQVEAANDAISKAKGAIIGIANALAVDLAPYIQTSAEMFTDWATEGEGAAARISTAFEGILGPLKAVSDGLLLAKLTVIDIPQKWAQFAMERSRASALNSTGPMPTEQTRALAAQHGIDLITLGGMQRKKEEAAELRKQAYANFEANTGAINKKLAAIFGGEEAGQKSPGLRSFFDRVEETKRANQVAKKKLPTSADPLGEDPSTETEEDTYRKKLRERADSINELVRGPLEAYNRAAAELFDLKGRSLITEDTYTKALQKEKDALDQATGAAQRRADAERATLNAKAGAESVRLAVRTPFEILQDEQARLRGMAGLLGKTTLGRAMGAAMDKFRNATEGPEEFSTAIDGVTNSVKEMRREIERPGTFDAGSLGLTLTGGPSARSLLRTTPELEGAVGFAPPSAIRPLGNGTGGAMDNGAPVRVFDPGAIDALRQLIAILTSGAPVPMVA